MKNNHKTIKSKCKSENDREARLAQVLVDVSRALASRYFEAGAESGAEEIGGGGEAAAIRLDFFVAWAADGDEGAEATVKLNEVECGFNATCLLGWYGTDLTELAVRFWQRGQRRVCWMPQRLAKLIFVARMLPNF